MRNGVYLMAAMLLMPMIGQFCHANEETNPAGIEFFKTKIRPVLARYCYECHSDQAEKKKAGLSVDYREGLRQGGKSGPAIVPGDLEKSLLIQAIRHTDPDFKMPSEKLPDFVIADFETWVKQGAPDPREKSDAKKFDPAEKAAKQWAFQPIRQIAPADVKAREWVKNPVDSFILAKLEQKGISPSPEADRRTLLRRLNFDLIGLPPTEAEINAFIADSSPDAYEKVVDRLLASPRYGERWGRHWLDVIRFAESNGFEMNNPRPNAWPFRDYVIRAFNEDKPYDKFVTEQLAGDVVGAPEATGFIVGGAWDQVTSPDPVLTAQQRADELHDMVSTTCSTFLGLTVGCARCHDHKFDPIPQTDYYSIQALFNSVKHGDRPLNTIASPTRQKEMAETQARLAGIEKELIPFEPVAKPVVDASIPKIRAPVHATLNVDCMSPVEAKFVRFTVLSTNNNDEPCIDELEIFGADDPQRNLALASNGAIATASSVYPGAAIHKLEHINEGLYGNSHSWISNEKGSGWVQIELRDKAAIRKVVWARDREGKYADRLATKYKIEVAVEPQQWKQVASSEDRKPYVKGAARQLDYSAEGMPADANKKLGALLAERDKLAAHLKELASPPLVYAGKFENPVPAFLLYRGDPMSKKQPVKPGVLSKVTPKIEMTDETSGPDRRMMLAKWITDPLNPLAARVMVNRIWLHHFGQGIVSTPSDFGANGGVPTHPELLDFLAKEFMARGWSIKAMHRMIVTSSTYRQSSAARTDAMAIDAGTRLLWRYPARRLEAEPIRDTILWVTGKLDLTMGGPGYDVFEPNSNYVRVYTPRKEFGPAEFRRMVYQFKPRMQQDDTFGAFDCPDGGQIAPKRSSSTTPLQALNLLNSNFMMQQSHFFAARLQKEAGAEIAAQVRLAFQLAYSRPPEPAEAEASAKIIAEQGLVIFCRALLNTNEFVYVF